MEMERYFKVSHEFAIKQAVEKLQFEIRTIKEIFNEEIDNETLKNELCSLEIFSDEELEFIVQKARNSFYNFKKVNLLK